MKRLLFLLTVSGFIFFIDQTTKAYFRQADLAQLNTGGILGLGGQWQWGLLVTIILVIVSLQLRHWSQLSYLEKVSWAVIVVSGLSNLVDRILFGGVWDWIVYPVVNVVGNIADIFLGVGGLLLVFSELRKKTK